MRNFKQGLTRSSLYILAVCLFAGNMKVDNIGNRYTDLDTNPGSPTDRLCDLGQVTAPRL